MPEEKTKKSSESRISEDERFRYIGFDVYPGKPKDLFESEAEKLKYVKAIKERRAKGELTREHCTLFEERISLSDRLIMTVAAVLILVSLFIPWYSAYNEIVEEASISTVSQEISDSLAMAALAAGDSLALAAGGVGDTLNTAAASPTEETPPTETPSEQEMAAATDTTPDTGLAGAAGTTAAEGEGEIIHGFKARKKITREFTRISGIGAVFSLGTLGSYIFSSGFVLILTAILFLVYTLLSIVLPLYTLYGVYGTKGDADQRAVKLKGILRLNWIPVIIFVFSLFIAFFGADYGFDAATLFTSLGTSYGVGVFINSLSWGLFVSLCCFILLAAKGIEI